MIMSLYLHAVQQYSSTALSAVQAVHQYTYPGSVLNTSAQTSSVRVCKSRGATAGLQHLNKDPGVLLERLAQQTHHTQLASPPNSAHLASTRAMSRVGSRLPSWMVSGPR